MQSSQRYSPPTLLNVYNTIVTSKGLAPQRMSAKTHGALAEFGRWCETQGIDPDTWIHAVHAARGWRFRVTPSKLISEKFVSRYRADFEKHSVRALDRFNDSRQVEENAPMWSDDLTHMGEGMKRAVGTERMSCLVNIAFTGGWNPKSPICRSCPLAAECRAQLPPDVQARRSNVRSP